MPETPRIVKWDVGDSLPSLNSPSYDEPSFFSTSSLEYINAQLIAHGFIPSPGLALEGLSNSAVERVVKCLLGMLSQRMEDMSRTEDLSTKLRTLSYDHERLISMHSTAKETAANAQRDVNVHKARYLAAVRASQSIEAAHKQTSAELQRTRTVVQGIRATHHNEIKKREKDIERLSEKWSKIADAQAKLMAIPSGICCANVNLGTGSEVIGKGDGFLEIALEEAEKGRSQLLDENAILKKLLLYTINELQTIIYGARSALSRAVEERPTPFTLLTLFPLHPAGNASEKWNSALNDVRETLTSLSTPRNDAPPPTKSTAPISGREIERLQGIIAALTEELEQSKKQNITQTAETQAMFDKFLRDRETMDRQTGEISVEPTSSPLRDEDKAPLDSIKQELELPVPAKQVTAPHLSPKKSPRKSPVKICVGKAGSSTKRKTTRITRRSLASPSKTVPAYETEVPPPILVPTFSSKPLLSVSLLPTSFVLPPPTPRTSLPTEPALPGPPPALPALNFSGEQSSPEDAPSPYDLNTVAPSTPSLERPQFPVAKPLAQRMIHAYSPAKPSPLSRILMLAKSPNSPELTGLGVSDVSGPLEPVIEDGGHVLRFDEQAPRPLPQSETLSLAAELGIPESPLESPQREKKLAPKANHPSRRNVAKTTSRGKVFESHLNKGAAREKGKAKVLTNGITGVMTSAEIDKERSRKSTLKPASVPVRVSSVRTTGGAENTIGPQGKANHDVTTSRARISTKLPPPGKDGPRRVPIDSAEAPPMMRARRG